MVPITSDLFPKSLLDPLNNKPMIDAVSLIPCNHVLSQKTADALLAGKLPCPLDNQPIENHVPNYTVRNQVIESLNKNSNSLNTSASIIGINSYPQALPLPLLSTHPATSFFNENLQELFFASCRKDSSKLEELINNGADVNAKELGANGQVMTPLAIVSELGDLAAVQLLIARGANVDAKCKFYKMNSQYDDWTALRFAAGAGHLSIVKELIKHKADVKIRDQRDTTILMYAAEMGYSEIVRVLIQNGANVNDEGGLSKYEFRTTKIKWTALMSAARQGKAETVKVLIELGADVNAESSSQETPLLLTSGVDAETVQLLIDHGANVQASSLSGNALHYAAKAGCLVIAQLLIRKGVPLDVRNYFNETPLILATHYAMNLKGSDNEEPLERALALMRLFLSNGANVNATEKENLHGVGINQHYTQRTLLMQAAKHGYLKVMKILLEFGANVDLETEDSIPAIERPWYDQSFIPKYFKATAFSLASKYAPPSVREEVKKLLIEHRRSSNANCTIM